MKYRLLLNKKKQITMQKNQRSEGARVAVIGGGTAGVFAAIFAAKNGADTVLIEKEFPAGCAATLASQNHWPVSPVPFEKLKKNLKSITAIVPEE